MHTFDGKRDYAAADAGAESTPTNGAKLKMARLQERYGLTRREAELALCLADGLSYGEIAERLHLSPHTVASHVKSILAKTQAGSSRKLAALIGKL